MERVHMDILGPLPVSASGNKYILVMIDQFSKWVEIHALPEQTAEQVARCAVDHLFSRFGAPYYIHTDQGSNFDSQLMKALCDIYRVTKTRTTPYHPSSNGQVERYNRLLTQLIRCYIQKRTDNWDQDLQLLAGAIRSMEHRSTGHTANMMMLGEEVNRPVDILFQTMGQSTGKMQDEDAYLKDLRETLKEVHDLARQVLKGKLRYMKRHYDLKLRQNCFEVGDFVYRLSQATKKGESRKLKPIWLGPLLVIEVLGTVLYRVKDRKKEHVLHHDKLKACHDRQVPLWLRKMKHQFQDLDETIAYDQHEADLDPAPEVPKPKEKLAKKKRVGPDQTALTSDAGLESSDQDLEPQDVSETPDVIQNDLDETIPAEDPSWEPDKPETELMLTDAENLGLTDLFRSSPSVADKKKRNRAKPKKPTPPIQMLPSLRGRQRKLPAHLSDFVPK